MKLTFEDIEDFDDFKQWFAKEADNYSALEKRYEGLLKHSKELEAENYELEMKNRRMGESLQLARGEAERYAKEFHELKNATAENSDE